MLDGLLYAAVIFDIDGTLINSKKAGNQFHLEHCKRKGIKLPDDLEQKDVMNYIYGLFQIGILNKKEFYQGYRPKYDKAAEKGLIELYPDTMRLLEMCDGIPKIAISVSSKYATLDKLNSLGIAKYFDSIEAHNFELAKPNPLLGIHALYLNGVSPNNYVINIGDRRVDMKFGRNIRAIYPNVINNHIQRLGDVSDSDTKYSDLIIKSLDEIKSLKVPTNLKR